jgi:hypothetical protein
MEQSGSKFVTRVAETNWTTGRFGKVFCRGFGCISLYPTDADRPGSSNQNVIWIDAFELFGQVRCL